MKNFRTLLLGSLVCIATTAQLNAQEQPAAPAAPPDTSSSSSKIIWTVGLHGVAIDDDGEPTSDLFNVGDSWNMGAGLSLDAAFNAHFSAALELSYATYKAGTTVNNEVTTEDNTFFAADVNAKYNVLADGGSFNFYPLLGVGYTNRTALETQTPTFNAGIGFNIMFVKSFGLNLQSRAKFKMSSGSSGYLHHSAGLIYRIGVK